MLALCLVATGTVGQTPEQREALRQFSREASARFAEERAAALRWADSLGLPVRQELPDGRVTELMRLRDGVPMYYITHNSGGAALINSDKVYDGGGAGLALSGAGQTLGIWDGGDVRASHQEFMTNGSSRVSIKNNSGLSAHATHVAGTMVAGGVISGAKGMAYEAYLDSYDWNDDEAEMALAADNGLNVSQHSYGIITGWYKNGGNWYWYGNTSVDNTEDYNWGFYSSQAEQWDFIAHNAPHYLISKSAGNDRSYGPGEQPISHYVRNQAGNWVPSEDLRELDGGGDGYTSISHAVNAKNIISVGAVDESGEMSDFSGWGPTDDGRIKPDIVAKGVSVYSTHSAANNAYASFDGTSMSGPMVAGSIGLLLEHQENLHPGEELLSATVKGLILHSADTDISGAPGPDYRFGWGLMDTGAAAGIMTRNADLGGNLKIREKTLVDGESISLTMRASGEEDLKATIVWTDPPGTPVDPPELNPTDLMLVNDLDMRLHDSGETTWKPYVLDPENPDQAATTGDNFRDNIEQILIDSPEAGELITLTINHKGTLEGGSQDFALILTGIQASTSYAGGSSSDWHDPDNWTHGDPEEIEHLIIPADATHFPVISTTATVQNLSVEDGASLTIADGGALTVAGDLDLAGSNSGSQKHFNPGAARNGDAALVIEAGGELTVDGTLSNHRDASALLVESDASGTGSLIHHQEGVAATIERYIVGDWSDALSGWHLLSAPVDNQDIEDFLPPEGVGGYDFYAYDEEANTWRNQKAAGWENFNDGTTFNTGWGYLVSWEETHTSVFAGEMHTNDLQVNDLSLTPGEGEGWHLLGNPYAAGLVWDATDWELQQVVHTAKIWDDGTYIDISSPGGIIPAMNGFFIQVTDAGNALTIPAETRVHDGEWHKSDELRRLVLEARATDSSIGQQTVVRVEPDAAAGFDYRYDSRFLAGYGPTFHALKEEETLSTISVPAIHDSLEIPLAFAGQGAETAHQIRLLESLPDTPVYLHDRLTGHQHPLHKESSYLFEDTPGLYMKPRFSLHFAKPGDPVSVPEPGEDHRIRAWHADGHIYLTGIDQEATITIYNTTGQQVSVHTPTGTQTDRVPAPRTPGVYLVEVNAPDQRISLKVVI